jgi:hypothetical protein
MQEEWTEISEFPGYIVSNYGSVRNLMNERIVVPSINPHNVAYVRLFHNRTQHTRSVAKLVADAFLPPPPRPIFNTPINLNGDRADNQVTNLLWRPRSFAIMYVKQFRYPLRHGFRKPVIEYDTEDVFENTFVAAITFGLLDIDIAKAAVNTTAHQKEVFPTYQRFDIYEEEDPYRDLYFD